MSGTYTIVCNQANTKVEERMLAEREAGTVLSSSVTIESESTTNGRKTFVLKRALAGASSDHYDLSGISNNRSLNVIYAVGGSQSLAYHGFGNKGTTSLTFMEQVTGMSSTAFKQSVEMYPNPAADAVNLKFARAAGETSIKVMTHQGQILLNERFESGAEVKVGLESISAGNYMLILKNDDHEAMFSLVKE